MMLSGPLASRKNRQPATDVGLLQGKAVFDVTQGSASSATATGLCHIALGTLLFMMIGSIAGLLLIRWIKRHLKTDG
jgi:hypothetical protein